MAAEPRTPSEVTKRTTQQVTKVTKVTTTRTVQRVPGSPLFLQDGSYTSDSPPYHHGSDVVADHGGGDSYMEQTVETFTAPPVEISKTYHVFPGGEEEFLEEVYPPPPEEYSNNMNRQITYNNRLPVNQKYPTDGSVPVHRRNFQHRGNMGGEDGYRYRNTPSPNSGTDGGYDGPWRDPELGEVLEFLSHPNDDLKANAAAYLQHLSYGDNDVKVKTRLLGGIPLLVSHLTGSEKLARAACGALRNLSYGRQNDENKKAMANQGGISAITKLLRDTVNSETQEYCTGVLWNLSSCEELKKPIIDKALPALADILPQSDSKVRVALQDCVVRNTTGILRNVSSEGAYARKAMREFDGLIASLIRIVKTAVERHDMDNKVVENCVCTLRNLSYRCQEIEDPHYDRHIISAAHASNPQPGEGSGCFGSKQKKDDQPLGEDDKKSASANSSSHNQKGAPHSSAFYEAGMKLLWHTNVVKLYIPLLKDCSNPETLEAAAGAIQNLAACYWQPSVEVRSAVRMEKGLPLLVELLRLEDDSVVCAAVTALRNLCMDQRNKELIGKYAMKDLVANLPDKYNSRQTSADTVAAVLATLNEVVRKNAEFAHTLVDTGGVQSLMDIAGADSNYPAKVQRFASQVLFNMWQHKDLHEVYKSRGWKEQNFVTQTLALQHAKSPPDSANNTLTRPISTQGKAVSPGGSLQRSPYSHVQAGRLSDNRETPSAHVTSPPAYSEHDRNESHHTVVQMRDHRHSRLPAGGVQVLPTNTPTVTLRSSHHIPADYNV